MAGYSETGNSPIPLSTERIPEPSRHGMGERSRSIPAPDLLGAVNDDGKKLQGVDIVVPKLEFSVTAYDAPQAVTTAFVADIARNTGNVKLGQLARVRSGRAAVPRYSVATVFSCHDIQLPQYSVATVFGARGRGASRRLAKPERPVPQPDHAGRSRADRSRESLALPRRTGKSVALS